MTVLGFCIYGSLHIKFGLDLQDLAPYNSYLRAFDNQLRRHFNTYDIPVDVFFPTKETPWWSSGYLAMVQELEDDLIGEPSENLIRWRLWWLTVCITPALIVPRRTSYLQHYSFVMFSFSTDVSR